MENCTLLSQSALDLILASVLKEGEYLYGFDWTPAYLTRVSLLTMVVLLDCLMLSEQPTPPSKHTCIDLQIDLFEI